MSAWAVEDTLVCGTRPVELFPEDCTMSENKSAYSENEQELL